MKLTVVQVLRSDCADGKTCPALPDTDRASCVLVGKVITDPAVLAALVMGEDEAAVEVPSVLTPGLPEIAWGTCIIVGKVVIDSEALGALGIGVDEMAVEVSASLLGR